MEAISIGDVYEAMGMAVSASQMFERAFVFAANLAIKQHDAETLDQVVPVVANKALKQPIKALLNELSGSVLPSDLENRIAALIERRHIVVHRLAEQTGWPTDHGELQRLEIRQFCLEVAAESLELHTVLILMLADWSKKFPSMTNSIEAMDFSDMYKSTRVKPPA